MRASLTMFPVRRVAIASVRRRTAAKRRGKSFGKMLGDLNAASDRLRRSRPR